MSFATCGSCAAGLEVGARNLDFFFTLLQAVLDNRVAWIWTLYSIFDYNYVTGFMVKGNVKSGEACFAGPSQERINEFEELQHLHPSISRYAIVLSFNSISCRVMPYRVIKSNETVM